MNYAFLPPAQLQTSVILFTKTQSLPSSTQQILCMEKLSVEIIRLVIDELQLSLLDGECPTPISRSKPHLAPYAAISKTWQALVEDRNFAFLQLERSELETFAEIIAAQPHRRTCLRRIHLILSEPSGESFQSGIRFLAQLLNEWDQNVDDDLLPQLKVSITGWGETRFDKASLLQMPLMRRVTSFFSHSGMRHGTIYPDVALQIASRMPRLETLAVQFQEPSRPLEHRRLARFQYRRQLGEALLRLQQEGCLSRLKHLGLNRFGYGPLNHSFELENVLDEEGVDRLCEAIRIFAQRSTSLEKLVLINILISPDLFRNTRILGVTEEPTWPTIQHLFIKSNILTPSGEWLYTGLPDSIQPRWVRYRQDSVVDFDEYSEVDDSDDGMEDFLAATDMNPHHLWRTQPDPQVLDPLLLDLIGAIDRMPKLRTGLFHLAPNRNAFQGLMFQWAQPGLRYMAEKDGKVNDAPKNCRRCKFTIGNFTDWEPSKKIMTNLQQWVGDGSVDFDPSTTVMTSYRSII
ncbi:unnamed protein product [Clonostachys chloroleuca]|uniref:F-box domain-containing protein n=1 Tax=Clonostachys chloroleuca TaxID=1926264 RepID=A0AA35MC68_9HYPO|nr:unnamed protein product [Clonostachys chloroleuca]